MNFPIHFGNNPPETAPLPDHVWISPTNSVPFKTRERDADVAALFTTLAETQKTSRCNVLWVYTCDGSGGIIML